MYKNRRSSIDQPGEDYLALQFVDVTQYFFTTRVLFMKQKCLVRFIKYAHYILTDF